MTISPNEIHAAVTGGDEDAIGNLSRQRLSQDSLKAFRTALVDLGGLRQVPEERRRRLTYTNGRLAGIVDVVVHLRMPQTRAFGDALPRPGDAATDYDEARHFIVGQKTQASLEPAPGQFYPEVMDMPKADRLITLARAHVDCAPTGMKMLNFYSLRARLTLSEAAKSAQPLGTTCALFLRAALVAAGDQRFVGNRAKLGIAAPGLGDMVFGMGLDKGVGAAPKPVPELRVPGVGRRWPKGPPTEIRRGDLYAVLEQREGIAESGHVGLVSEVHPAGDEVMIRTIDGGQRNISTMIDFESREWLAAAYSNSKGWYVKERDGKFARQAGHWVKLSRRGLTDKYSNRAINTTVNGKKVAYKRSLYCWVSMKDVPFEAPQHDFGY